jgi:hypothetical protein
MGIIKNNIITVATSITDIIYTHCYCDSITFMLKWMHRLHLGFILDILHMHKKLSR